MAKPHNSCNRSYQLTVLQLCLTTLVDIHHPRFITLMAELILLLSFLLTSFIIRLTTKHRRYTIYHNINIVRVTVMLSLS